MKKFKIKFKKTGSFFWKSRVVVGSKLDTGLNRLTLYYEDGSIEELAKYSDMDVKLGLDWVLATKDALEKESGQNIKLSV